MSEQAPSPVDVDLVGRVVGGRFRIESRLGGGGMGTVWRAHDEQLLRPCAVKTLYARALDDPDARERFIREARAAAAIGGRYVVGFIAADFDPGDDDIPPFPFLAMDLLVGEDLEQRLQARGPFPVDDAITFLGQAAKAIDRAHELGIIHRDIKPENIFLTREDDEVVAKVLDFGIAKVTSAMSADRHRLTRSNATLGSPLYIAPEQILDTAGAEAQSDLWSFALVAFRILTGQEFWKLTDLARLVHQICYEPLPSACERSGGRLPPEVDKWFAKAMDHDPRGRFSSASEMITELARTLAAAAPTTTHPDNPTEAPGDLLQSQAMQGVARPVDGFAPARSTATGRSRKRWLFGAPLFVLCLALIAGFLSAQHFGGKPLLRPEGDALATTLPSALAAPPKAASADEPLADAAHANTTSPIASASASGEKASNLPRPPKPQPARSMAKEPEKPPPQAPPKVPKDDDFGNITRQ